MLKKIGFGILIGIVVLIVVLIVGRNIIIKSAVTTGVKAVTGLNLKIDKMNIGFAKTLLGIEGMVLENPSEFPDKVMMDLPEIYVDYDLGAMLKKKVHLSEVRLELKEFIVVRNKEGKLNMDSLTAIQSGKTTETPKKEEKEAKPAEKIDLQIDLLKIKIGKVIEKDYSAGGEPKIKEHNINIDETFENITDPNQVVNIILAKTYTYISAQILKNSAAELFKKSSKKLLGDALGTDEVTENAVKQTTDKLKKLLPF